MPSSTAETIRLLHLVLDKLDRLVEPDDEADCRATAQKIVDDWIELYPVTVTTVWDHGEPIINEAPELVDAITAALLSAEPDAAIK